MSTQAITVTPTAGPLALSQPNELLDLLRPTPIILVQGTTQGMKGVAPGVFADRMSGRVLGEEFKIVLFDAHMMRDKYPSATFVKGERQLCRSFDGLVPVIGREDLVPQAPNCLSCEHCSDNRAAWKGYDRATKTGPKPTCKTSARIVYAEFETPELPYYSKIVNKNSKDVDRLKETLMRDAILRNGQNKRKGDTRQINIFDYVITVKAVAGSSGSYYNWQFAKIDIMTAEMAAEYAPLAASLQRRKMKLQEQLDQQEAAEEVVEGEAV